MYDDPKHEMLVGRGGSQGNRGSVIFLLLENSLKLVINTDSLLN